MKRERCNKRDFENLQPARCKRQSRSASTCAAIARPATKQIAASKEAATRSALGNKR